MRKQKLIAMRKSKNFTQHEIANMMAMEQTTYSRKERGISPITNEEWKRLAKALNTSIEEIQDDDISMPYINVISSFENVSDEKLISLPLSFLNILTKYTSKLEKDINKLKKKLKNKN